MLGKQSECIFSTKSGRVIGVSNPSANELLVTCSSETFVFDVVLNQITQKWLHLARNLTVLTVSNGEKLFSARQKESKNTVLVSWSKQANDLTNVTTQSTETFGQIQQIHTLAQGCLVTFTNGNFAVYDTNLSLLHFHKHTNDQLNKIVWSKVVVKKKTNDTSSTKSILLLITETNTPQQYHINMYELFTKKKIVQPVGSCEFPSPATAASPITSAVFHPTSFSLSVFYSNGEWKMCQLKYSKEDGALQIDSSRAVAKLNSSVASEKPAKKKQRTMNKEIFATCVGDSSRVITCFSNSNNAVCWDVQYGVKVEETDLFALDNSKKHSTANLGGIISLSNMRNGETIVSTFEHGVILTSFNGQASSLANILGIAASAADRSSIAPSLSFIPVLDVKFLDSLPKGDTDHSKWSGRYSSKDSTHNEVLEKLLQTNDREVFITTFTEYLRGFSSDPKEPLHFCARSLSQKFIIEVATKIVSSPEMGLWDELEALIRSHHLSARAIPNLFPVLMKHDRYRLLEDCMMQFQDIPEKYYVLLIKFFIKVSNKKSFIDYVHERSKKTCTKKMKRSAEEMVEFEKDPRSVVSYLPVERFLNLLVSCPKNTAFLQNSVRKLSIDEVLFMFTFLKKNYYILANQSSLAIAKSSELGRIPDLEQIIDWISIILDIHVAQLIVQSSDRMDIKKLLEELQQIVESHIESCTEIAQIHVEIAEFLSGKTKLTRKVPEYSAEFVLV